MLEKLFTAFNKYRIDKIADRDQIIIYISCTEELNLSSGLEVSCFKSFFNFSALIVKTAQKPYEAENISLTYDSIADKNTWLTHNTVSLSPALHAANSSILFRVNERF